MIIIDHRIQPIKNKMVLTSGGLHHCFNILSSQRMQADQSTQNVENCSCVCLCTCSHVHKCVMQQWVSGVQPVNLKVTASSGLALLMRFLILFFFFRREVIWNMSVPSCIVFQFFPLTFILISPLLSLLSHGAETFGTKWPPEWPYESEARAAVNGGWRQFD